jgi:ribosomal-protein-alanine N-acetyltransferase
MGRMPGEPNSEIRIRKFRGSDLGLLYDIDRTCFPVHMAYSRAELLFYLRHPSSICRIAELDGTVIGFAVALMAPHSRAHVVTIDVIPEARRNRVGTLLMETLHAAFRESDVVRVRLEVAAADTGAQHFYQRLGYVRRELLPGYYQGCEDAYRMSLDL